MDPLDKKAPVGRWKLVAATDSEMAAPLWVAEDGDEVVYVRGYRIHNPKVVGRLRQVARFAEPVEHETVLKARELVEVPGGVAIVSRYEEGLPLSTVLNKARRARRPIPPPIAAAIALDILESLHAAGGRLAPAWAHGGARPECIVLTRGGRARRLEVGVASVVAEVEPLSRDPKWLAYASPELVSGSATTAASDVFSVGLILREMLSGRQALEGLRYADLKKNLTAGKLAPLGTVPKAIVAVLDRALDVDPGDRFDGARSFADALREAFDEVAEPYAVSELFESLEAASLTERRRVLERALGKAAPTSMPPPPRKTSTIPRSGGISPPSFGVPPLGSLAPESPRRPSNRPPAVGASNRPPAGSYRPPPLTGSNPPRTASSPPAISSRAPATTSGRSDSPPTSLRSKPAPLAPPRASARPQAITVPPRPGKAAPVADDDEVEVAVASLPEHTLEELGLEGLDDLDAWDPLPPEPSPTEVARAEASTPNESLAEVSTPSEVVPPPAEDAAREQEATTLPSLTTPEAEHAPTPEPPELASSAPERAEAAAAEPPSDEAPSLEAPAKGDESPPPALATESPGPGPEDDDASANVPSEAPSEPVATASEDAPPDAPPSDLGIPVDLESRPYAPPPSQPPEAAREPAGRPRSAPAAAVVAQEQRALLPHERAALRDSDVDLMLAPKRPRPMLWFAAGLAFCLLMFVVATSAGWISVGAPAPAPAPPPAAPLPPPVAPPEPVEPEPTAEPTAEATAEATAEPTATAAAKAKKPRPRPGPRPAPKGKYDKVFVMPPPGN